MTQHASQPESMGEDEPHVPVYRVPRHRGISSRDQTNTYATRLDGRGIRMIFEAARDG